MDNTLNTGMDKKIHIFSDIDLDGATSYTVLLWSLHKQGYKHVTVTFANITNIRKEFLKWALDHNLNDYHKIYFLDLDTSACSDIIDRDNVVIIDHHESHVNVKDIYKNAETHIRLYTSCAKLIYKEFPNEYTDLTDQEKMLILLTDDYDSYTLKYPNSYKLNCLFTNTQKKDGLSRSGVFAKRFYFGFSEFLKQERFIIDEYISKRDKAIKELDIYTGEVSIGGAPRKIYGTMGTKFVNDICEHLIKTYDSDIVFFLNLNSEHVSIRKNNEKCDVNLASLAEKLLNGGGHQYAAGGKITPKFEALVKTLTPLNQSKQ